jgi:DNA-binding Lrp family transcriptional regulator
MGVVSLGAKDLRILAELDFNARITDSRLAKVTRLSKDSVRYRIRALEEKGVIKKYFIVPNTPLLGLISIKVMVKYLKTSPETEEAILSYLQAREEVGWLVETDGAFDLVFIVWAKSVFEFEGFYDAFLSKFNDYFFERKMVVLTENHACNKKYLAPSRAVKEVFYRGENLCTVDTTDTKIIGMLKENARAGYVEIGRAVGLTPEAASYRVKRLVKGGIIQAFRAMIDLEKIGLLYYNVLLRLRTTTVLPQIFAFCKEHRNITYFAKYVGEYDIGIDIEVRNPAEFRAVMKEIRQKFGESLLTYDYVRIYRELKISY